MKKFIKLTALLLCIAMLTTTFAGCGLFKKDDEPEDEFNPPYLDNYYVNNARESPPRGFFTMGK